MFAAHRCSGPRRSTRYQLGYLSVSGAGEYPDAELSEQDFHYFVNYFLVPAGLLMVVFSAVLLAVSIPVKVQARARDTAYRAYCATREYQYATSRPGAEQAYANIVSFFNEGVYRFWRYEISGMVDGFPFVAFEYAYRDQGRYAPLIVHAVMKWEESEKELPVFFLLPASIFYDLAGPHPAPRIQFPDDPFFTETYALLTSDPEAVRAFLTPEIHSGLRTWLAADPEQYVLSEEKMLFWYQVGYLRAPDQLDEFIKAGDKLRAVLLS